MPPQSCQEIEEGVAGHEHCSCTPDKVRVCAAAGRAQLGTAESLLWLLFCSPPMPFPRSLGAMPFPRSLGAMVSIGSCAYIHSYSV